MAKTGLTRKNYEPAPETLGGSTRCRVLEHLITKTAQQPDPDHMESFVNTKQPQPHSCALMRAGAAFSIMPFE